MKRTAVALALVLWAISVPALASPSQNKIASDVAAVLKRPILRASQFGAAFYDLDRGRMVYALHADRYYVAASTTKLLTESTSLSLLGPDYRFTTTVYRDGAIDSAGTLHGNIVLRAAGDPNLSGRIQPNGTLAFENEDHAYGGSMDTRAVPGDPLAVIRDFAKQISAHGIKSVTGRVIVDDSLFPDTTQELGTGTTVAPIVVNDNVVDVTVSPANKIGDPVRISVSPATAYVTFVNKATTGPPHSPNTTAMTDDVEVAPGNRRVTLAGSFPSDSRPILYDYPVPSPRRFAEIALTQALADAGVRIEEAPGDAPIDAAALARAYLPGNAIAQHVSPPLSQDVKVTLKVSDNLHAAMMPYLWGVLVAHDKTDPQSAGFKLERSLLAREGFDPLQFVQNDGEGANAFFRPAQIVRFLAYVRRQPYFDSLYRGLPILGVDGTLFDIQKRSPAAGHVHAKTGTNGTSDMLNGRFFLSGKGLAGYMTTKSGRHLAFCLYLNNFGGPATEDVTETTGQILGEIADDGYLDL